MSAIILLVVFMVLTFFGVPIAMSLGLSSMIFLFFDLKVPLAIIVQRIFTGLDSFPIMAIPFFVLAGAAMSAGGLTTRIVAFANAVVGWVRGGMALVSVVACMIISGLSGSAIGGVMIPAMKKSGYSAEFTAGLIGSAAGLGPIIPQYGDKIVFWGGGIDTQNTLPFGTPEQVRREVLENCTILGANGGFVFSSVHNIQAKTPIENVVAMFDAVHEFNGTA